MQLTDDYRRLRDEIDGVCSGLERLHIDHLCCSEGCSECCMDFRILPVEFYSIREELAGRSLVVNRSVSEGECVFLNGGICSIYEMRPIICRTHGLPLLGMGEENWELSFCHRNFASDPPEFDAANTFPVDRYNSRLFMLNRQFIRDFSEPEHNEFDLLPLSDLVSNVQPQ